jgi:vacuolar-type H+-ATPase subunit H
LPGPYHGVEIHLPPVLYTGVNSIRPEPPDYVPVNERQAVKPITMNKETLLKILEENRGKHRTVFEDALEGYAEEAEKTLQAHLNAIRKGRTPDIRIILDRPEDHTKDYDRIIGMLKLHLGDTWELDEQSYRMYVDDDWAWKRQWIDTSNQYAAGSVQAVYGE